jgi:hypothetical protein
MLIIISLILQLFPTGCVRRVAVIHPAGLVIRLFRLGHAY